MTTDELKNRLERRIKALTAIRGVQNNELTRSLVWAQEMNRYTTGIVEHDVLEGMPTALFFEFKESLERSSKAEFYSAKDQMYETREILKVADRGSDDVNPRFIFSGADTSLLVDMLHGTLDVESLIRIELDARCFNRNIKPAGTVSKDEAL